MLLIWICQREAVSCFLNWNAEISSPIKEKKNLYAQLVKSMKNGSSTCKIVDGKEVHVTFAAELQNVSVIVITLESV